MYASTFRLDRNTIFALPDDLGTALENCWAIFSRDFAKVFGSPARTGDAAAADVRFEFAATSADAPPEAFRLSFAPDAGKLRLTVAGSDELGLIYGILHLSQHALGVDPFWFWTDREPMQQTEIALAATDYTSPKPRVRYRGWFVNDEVCLLGMSDTYPPGREIWAPVYETLLRLGGNIVIPGTDLPRSGAHWQLASEMGLYITQHHAEPLGAEMFHRAHPTADASYSRNPELFHNLWADAIVRHKGQKVVWALGFRGQGDQPFWEQDPSCDTPQSRGALISRVIFAQHDMLKTAFGNPKCLTYIYGELTELYREGHLVIPPGVTRIWSDNGYGRMVSRRQWADNPRLPSLPKDNDPGPHGVYYHATFHDLQASSHLAMLPVPTPLLASELDRTLAAGADDVFIVNCGNVRPHIYTLDLISRFWTAGSADAASFDEDFARRHFPSAPAEATCLLRDYFDAAIKYGPHDDDMAGDEFYHHPARSLVGHVMRGETSETADDLTWATGNLSFAEQAAWFENACGTALPRFRGLRERCSALAASLDPDEAVFFSDFLGFQARLHETGCLGTLRLCQAIAAHREGAHPKSFVLASQSLWAYRDTLEAMDKAEHGKWAGYFRFDWLTNVRMTAYAVDSFRRYLRTFGDNPDYFLWYKEFLMPENEKRVHLENTHRNPPSDDDLAERLGARFELEAE